MAGLLPAQGTQQCHLPLPRSPVDSGSPTAPRACVCQSVGSVCPRPGQRAALTCSHRRRHQESEAGAQPRGSVSVVCRLAPPRTAALLEHRSRDATKKPAPTPCPEPPPSSPIPERSSRLLAACEALGEGGAGRRYRARVGRGRAGGRKEGCRLWGWGRRGEAAARAAPPRRQPPALTVVTLPACWQPHSPCASPAGVGWMGLQSQEQLEALGACWSGVGVGFLVTVVIAGVL